MNFLPQELENIIMDFKTNMEEYEKQFEKIDELFESEEMCPMIDVNIAYIDLREYLFRKNITHLKFQIGIYGTNHPNNYKLWELDLIKDDDTLLEDYNIDQIVYIAYSNNLCLKFNVGEEDKIIEIDNEDNNINVEDSES